MFVYQLNMLKKSHDLEKVTLYTGKVNIPQVRVDLFHVYKSHHLRPTLKVPWGVFNTVEQCFDERKKFWGWHHVSLKTYLLPWWPRDLSADHELQHSCSHPAAIVLCHQQFIYSPLICCHLSTYWKQIHCRAGFSIYLFFNLCCAYT